MTDFMVGQKVVCVNSGASLLEQGRVYTIEKIHSSTSLGLVEYRIKGGMYANRFRAISDDQSTIDTGLSMNKAASEEYDYLASLS